MRSLRSLWLFDEIDLIVSPKVVPSRASIVSGGCFGREPEGGVRLRLTGNCAKAEAQAQAQA